MKKRNWQNIRNSIVMLCVMLAMLSTVTYAWFTLTDSPTVSGLQMTAKAADSLLVSKEEATGYASELILTSVGDKLNPVTVVNKTPTFAKPIYTGNNVNDVEALDTTTINTSDNGYVLKYTYYLKYEADETNAEAKVGLLGSTEANKIVSGTFVKQDGSNDATTQDASAAIRIGFSVNGKWIVYEPNITEFEGTSATNGYTSTATPDINIQQNSDGTFVKSDGSGKSITSDALFTVKNNEPVQVDMYVWLEGTDKECVDEIQTDELMGQIQFTIVE